MKVGGWVLGESPLMSASVTPGPVATSTWQSTSTTATTTLARGLLAETQLEEELQLEKVFPPLCSRHLPLSIAGGVALLAATFALLDALAPSAEEVCHRLNLTTPEGLPCVVGVEGRVCTAQATDCTVLGEVSYLIQLTEAAVIAVLLLLLWRYEKPRRHFVQFCADNSKSVMLALTTHFLVLVISALLGDVTVPKCTSRSDLHPGAEPCDWYIVTFMLDDFVGVPITLLLYTITARLALRYPRFAHLGRIGDYEAPRDPSTGAIPPSSNVDRVRRWGWQVAHWLLCALVSRVAETAVLFLLLQPLMRVANTLGWWACTKGEVVTKQWIHLMFAPIVLDLIQFTVQNYILDGRVHSGKLHDSSSTSAAAWQ